MYVGICNQRRISSKLFSVEVIAVLIQIVIAQTLSCGFNLALIGTEQTKLLMLKHPFCIPID